MFIITGQLRVPRELLIKQMPFISGSMRFGYRSA